jgi:hypothetical protein
MALKQSSVTTVQRQGLDKTFTNRFQTDAKLAIYKEYSRDKVHGEVLFRYSLQVLSNLHQDAIRTGRRTIRPSAHSRTCSS